MDIDKLRNYFYNLLQKRDYSEFELADKASLKGYLKPDIQIVLKELKQRNFVNDQRLAENLILAYQGKKGKMWIKQKMIQRRLPKNIVQDTFESEELPNLTPDKGVKEKLERKYDIENWSDIDLQTKQKIIRFLAGQGFAQPFEILKQWQENL
jgi:SOS response regulatory protein OraA/RecX